MEKCNSIFEKWINVNNELRNACIEYLNSILDKVPFNVIEIDDDYPVSCAYDGGNHPEYNSNCFSKVLGVHKNPKNNNIYLDIEDADNYSIDSVSAETLYYICESVKNSVEKNYEIE